MKGIGRPTFAFVVLHDTEQSPIAIKLRIDNNLFFIYKKKALPAENIKYKIMDWENEYNEMHMRLIELRHRCSSYRQAAEHALCWLKKYETKNIHPATNISHLSDKQIWGKIESKKQKLSRF